MLLLVVEHISHQGNFIYLIYCLCELYPTLYFFIFDHFVFLTFFVFVFSSPCLNCFACFLFFYLFDNVNLYFLKCVCVIFASHRASLINSPGIQMQCLPKGWLWCVKLKNVLLTFFSFLGSFRQVVRMTLIISNVFNELMSSSTLHR